MKKKLGLILAIFVFLLSITSVDAAVKKGDKVTLANSKKESTDGLGYGSQSSTSFIDYTFTINGTNFTGFCLDPNLHGTTTLKVDRILGDGVDGDVAKFDAALLAILKNGYVNSSSSFQGLTGVQLKAATDLAVRALTLGTMHYGRGKIAAEYGHGKPSAYVNLGAHWAALYPELSKVLVSECATSGDYDTIKECYNKRNKRQYSWLNTTTFWATDGTAASNVLNAGRDLYKLGLEAAQNYSESTSGNGSITVTEIENMEFDEPVLPDTKEIWKVVNFNIKGASDSQYVKNVTVVCGDDCAANGFKIGRVQYKSGSDWVALTTDVDLSKHVDANGNVQIRFEVTQDMTITGCTGAHYKLSYNENISGGSSGLVGIVAKQPNTENTQRYVMLIEVGEATTGEDAKQDYNGKLVCDGDPDDHEPEDPEDPWDPDDPGEPRKNPCRTRLQTPVCEYDASTSTGTGSGSGTGTPGTGDDGTGSTTCSEKTETYYSTTWATVAGGAHTYTYELKLKNQDASKIESLSLRNKTYFTTLGDYDTYLRTRDQYIEMIGANVNYNSYAMSNANSFKQHSATNSNFTFTISDPVKKADDTGKEYFYVTVTITVNNVNGITEIDDPRLGKLYYVPVKFDVYYTPTDCASEGEEGNFNDGAISTDKNIKKCILNNTDDAGNSYELTTADGVDANNRYCKVFCKEDYAYLKMEPVVKDVKCGGYFKLTAYVEGNKDCYTSGGSKNDYAINRPKFEEDIKTSQVDMIDAMSEYLEAKAVLDDMYQDFSCPAGSAGNWAVREGEYSYYEPQVTTTSAAVNAIPQRGTHKYSLPSPTDNDRRLYTDVLEYAYYDNNWLIQWEFNILKAADFVNVNFTRRYGYELTIVVPNDNDAFYIDTRYVRGAMDDAYYDLTGYGATLTIMTQEEFEKKYYPSCMAENTLKSVLEQNMRDAENRIKKAQDRMDSAVINFNDCTTSWTNTYNFDHTIRFEYAESYNDMLSSDEKIMQKVGDPTERTEIEVCLGNVTNEYDCPVGEGYIFADQDNSNIEEVLTSAGVISPEDFTFCSIEKNGCSKESYKVSQAKFVRRSVYKSQDYITPTVFYQTEVMGKITTKSTYNGNALTLKPIENGLPVAISTTGGGNFWMIISDLGEFYDSGDLGRLIDFDGDREQDSVAYAQDLKRISTFNGRYVCYYESPCRKPDCPTCEYVCLPEPCEWRECPTCDYTCINCIFNLNELQLNFNSISTNNFNSVDRKRGYNWDITTNLGIVGEKAQATIDEIIADNETIYKDSPEINENDQFVDNRISDDSSLVFSIRMTPAVINDLLEYNKSVEDVGGYANDTMTCYDYEVGGKTIDNLLCYSEKIDDLIAKFGDQIITKNRTSEGMRNTDPNSEGYWTLWNGYVYSESAIGGPAWK